MVDETDENEYNVCSRRGHEVTINVIPKPHKVRCKHCNIPLIWQPPVEGYWYSLVNADKTSEMTKRETVRESAYPHNYRPV